MQLCRTTSRRGGPCWRPRRVEGRARLQLWSTVWRELLDKNKRVHSLNAPRPCNLRGGKWRQMAASGGKGRQGAARGGKRRH
eukprot:scaffold761_cov105-Pinguiococcus_pyrenoidosus.AAC.1